MILPSCSSNVDNDVLVSENKEASNYKLVSLPTLTKDNLNNAVEALAEQLNVSTNDFVFNYSENTKSNQSGNIINMQKQGIEYEISYHQSVENPQVYNYTLRGADIEINQSFLITINNDGSILYQLNPQTKSWMSCMQNLMGSHIGVILATTGVIGPFAPPVAVVGGFIFGVGAVGCLGQNNIL